MSSTNSQQLALLSASVSRTDSLMSPHVRANKNVYDAVGSDDPYVLSIYRDVAHDSDTIPRLKAPLTTDRRLISKPLHAPCIRTLASSSSFDAAVQTDPWEPSLAEFNQLRETIVQLHTRSTAQALEIDRLSHAARNSVSQHYLDSVAALTPSQATVAAAVSVCRETLGASLLQRVTRREARELMAGRVRREELGEARRRVEHVRSLSLAVASELDRQRQEHAEARAEAAAARQAEVERVEAALARGESLRLQRERRRAQMLEEQAQGSDSDPDADGPPSPTMRDPRVSEPADAHHNHSHSRSHAHPHTGIPALAHHQPHASASAPASMAVGSAADEALRRRVAQLEAALALWEPVGGDLGAKIEAAIQSASDSSLARRLRDALEACVEELTRVRADLAAAQAAVRGADADSEAIQALQAKLDALLGAGDESGGGGEVGGVRGAFMQVSQQHRDTAAQLRQIKQLVATHLANTPQRSGAGKQGGGHSSFSRSPRLCVPDNKQLSKSVPGADAAAVARAEARVQDAAARADADLRTVTRTLMQLDRRLGLEASHVENALAALDAAVGALAARVDTLDTEARHGAALMGQERLLLARTLRQEGAVAGLLDYARAQTQRGQRAPEAEAGMASASVFMTAPGDTYAEPLRRGGSAGSGGGGRGSTTMGGSAPLRRPATVHGGKRYR